MVIIVKFPNRKFRIYVKGISEILLTNYTKAIINPKREELAITELSEIN